MNGSSWCCGSDRRTSETGISLSYSFVRKGMIGHTGQDSPNRWGASIPNKTSYRKISGGLEVCVYDGSITVKFDRRLEHQFCCPAGALCNMKYPSETRLNKFKSRKILFVYNFRLSCPIVLKFCIEHDSISIKTIGKMINNPDSKVGRRWAPVLAPWSLLFGKLWANKISRDLGVKWVADGYHGGVSYCVLWCELPTSVDFFYLSCCKMDHRQTDESDSRRKQHRKR